MTWLLASGIGLVFVTLVLLDTVLLALVMRGPSSASARASWGMGALGIAVGGILAIQTINRYAFILLVCLLAIHVVRYASWRRGALQRLMYTEAMCPNSCDAAFADRIRLAVCVLDDLVEAIGLRRHPTLAVDPTNNVGPALVGSLRPIIVVPADALQADAVLLRAMFAHELAHFLRVDTVRSWFLVILSSSLAWHPLARRMSESIRLAIEMQCDQIAARWVGRVPYARALIQWADRIGNKADMVSSEQAAYASTLAFTSDLGGLSVSARVEALTESTYGTKSNNHLLLSWAVLPYAAIWFAVLRYVLQLCGS